jgi:hypothetical protein
MNAHPHDDDGVPSTVYVLHFEPAYQHARHYIGWTAEAVDVRLQTHLEGRGSPLIRSSAQPSRRASTSSSSPPTRAAARWSGA